MTYPNIKAAALAFYCAFEQRTIGDRPPFYVLKDGRPDWMRGAIYEAHNGILLDDWSYSACYSIVSDLADCDEADTESDIRERSDEFIGGRIDEATSRLAAWLASHSARVGYCDEAADDYGAVADIRKAMQRGQHLELSQIFNAILSALVEQVEA